MKYLTLGSCLKNEEEYIVDFIKYHRYVGVDNFVFLDRSYDKLHALIGHEPDVEIIHFPEIPGNNHMAAWGHLIKHCQGNTRWLALIDADQALVPVQTHNVKDILSNYEEFASLQINWKAFGSGGQQKRLPGSVYERFTKVALPSSKYSEVTQFICQPDRTLALPTEEPHYPHLASHEISVNTNKEIIDGNKHVPLNPIRPKIFQIPPLYDVMWVAHYTNKSYEEWLIKNSKGRADIIGAKIHASQFMEYDSECTEPEYRVSQLWMETNGSK